MSEEEKTFIRENHANAKKDPAKEGEPKVQYFFEINRKQLYLCTIVGVIDKGSPEGTVKVLASES